MEKQTTVTINVAGPANTGKTVWVHLILQALTAKGLNVSVTENTAHELQYMGVVNIDEIIEQLKDRLNIVINQEHLPMIKDKS